jgi:hypothetical protein
VDLKRFCDQLVLASKEVIKAAFANTGALANGVDPDGAVAVDPDQIGGGLDQLLPRIAHSTHDARME